MNDRKVPKTLSKSRFALALECPRKLAYVADEQYVNAKRDDDFLSALAEYGHQVGSLAKLMYPEGIEIVDASIDEQVRQTEHLLQRENVVIFEATFRHGALIARIDILVKRLSLVHLVEVKSKKFAAGADSFWGKKSLLSEWRPYLCDVAF